MKKFTRILALLLALISVFSMLVACGGNKDKNNGDNTKDPGVIGAGTEEDPKIEAVDYEGHEFTFITQDSNDYGYKVKYLVSTGEEGNLLDDAIAKRNAIIEEKYNITIAQNDVADIVTTVRTQIMGGNPEFDAILANADRMSNMAREGLLYNLLDIERFDMTKSYWDQRAAEELKMAGKLYYTNCDLNIHSIGTAIYFNKKLIQDYELTSPYEYMENGQWTIDNWAKLAKSISRDVNNDGAMTEFDQYGSLAGHGQDTYFVYGSGIRFTTNDENGYPQVTLMDNSDKLVRIYEKTKEVFSDTSVTYCINCSNVGDNGYSSKWEYLRTLFTQDLYLFDITTDDVLTIYRDMESEFGIVPIPKYDENQDNYKTLYPRDFNLFGLPSVIENVERTTNIIEDLNYYSNFILVPVWFDTILTRRYTRDDESEATLRFIKENRVYDVGRYYDLGQFSSKVFGAKSSGLNIVREFDRYKKAIEADIKVIYKDFAKHDAK